MKAWYENMMASMGVEGYEEPSVEDTLRSKLHWQEWASSERESQLRKEVAWARQHPEEWLAWESLRPTLFTLFRDEYGFEEFLAEVGPRLAGRVVARKDKTLPFEGGNLVWGFPDGELEPIGRTHSSEKPFTTKEFAVRVGRSAYTVRKMCKEGLIRGELDTNAPRSGEWRIPASELERWRREGGLQLSRKPK